MVPSGIRSPVSVLYGIIHTIPASSVFIWHSIISFCTKTDTGGMQDYNYIFHGTMEITLEVSCCKHPMASTLEQHWMDNRKVNKDLRTERIKKG